MPEQLLIQPSLDQQNLCIGDLLSDINEYAGYDGCTPLDNVDREFFATVASCKDKELLNLGLNRIIVLIQRCQSGCKAIEIARRKKLPNAQYLACNQGIDLIYKIIDKRINLEQFLKQEGII